MEKHPQGTRQGANNRKEEPKGLRSSDSLALSFDTISQNSADDIMSMILQEKKIAMDPEKRESLSGFQRSFAPTNGDLESNSTPLQRVGRRLSTPGAFRVGADDDFGAHSIAGDSDGSESCIIMIPRASLVQEEKSEQAKDLEVPSTKAPMVHAERTADSLRSASSNKQKSRKRPFRLCMILLCLLVASLLGGVLFYLLKEDSAVALESTATDANIFEEDTNSEDSRGSDGGRGGGSGDGKRDDRNN